MIKVLLNYSRFKKLVLRVLVIAVCATSVFTVAPKPAYACCGCCSGCECYSETWQTDLQNWIQDWIEINLHIWLNMFLHRLMWFDWTYWQGYMLPAFQQMGVQLAAVGTQQVMAIGMFIDAKEQLETQRLLQQLHAKANKDYTPSHGMCEFGTRIKSLAAAERKGEVNALILSERSLDRMLGNTATGAAGGIGDDVTIRLGKFREEFCDGFDNNAGLDLVCPDLAPGTYPSDAEKSRFNKDIDFQKTVLHPMTINFDLTGGGVASEGDEEVIALANNLYGFDTFSRVDPVSLQNHGSHSPREIQNAYMDMRSVVAKNNVAENSFNALMALKGEGTVGSRQFLESYLEELGIPQTEVQNYLGTNPSYHAQMEILTKKAYQSPLFYTNLYDKPTNVERKNVAMQAISLIQKFDLLKSYLRTEASLSVLLELSVDQLQRDVNDAIQALNIQE
ncbi:MAG: hypothetical protein ACRBCK_01660 [Alphaproteobacteria bacterium]